MIERIQSGLIGDLVGYCGVCRFQDVQVFDGVMTTCELTQADDLQLDDTYVFPASDSLASFMFDGRHFRLINTAEKLLCSVEQVILMSDRAETVVAFTLRSLSSETHEMYFGLPQVFDPDRRYRLIDRRHL